MTAGLPTEGGYIRVSSNTPTPALKLKGSTSGSTKLVSAATASGTLTLPSVTDTVATIGTAQTWTAAQTFSAGYNDAVAAGSSAGVVTNYGVSTLSTANSTAYYLPAPSAAGAKKYLYATGAVTVTTSGATVGEVTSSLKTFTFTATNQMVQLEALSTAKWGLVCQNSTAITLA